MREEKIACALIGYGYWGHIVERYLEGSEMFQLKYVYAPSLDNGITMDKILSDERVGAVFLCTPIDTHYRIVRECLSHGKHVFCEKPLTKGYREAARLAELAEANRLCLYTDYIYLDSPSMQYLKNQMKKIGDILSVRGEICQFGNFYENDSVMEVLGVHLISSILYLLGLECCPEIVAAEVLREDKGIITEMEVRMNCMNRIKVTLLCSLVSAVKSRRLYVSGRGGYWSLTRWGNIRHSFSY